MLLRQIYDADLSQYTYIIGCEKTGEAIVIDPERDVDRYLAIAISEGLICWRRQPGAPVLRRKGLMSSIPACVGSLVCPAMYKFCPPTAQEARVANPSVRCLARRLVTR